MDWETYFATEAIPAAIKRLDEAKKERDRLRKAKHGHEFNWDRVCIHCSLPQRDYDFFDRDPIFCTNKGVPRGNPQET